jgi:F-type H+-transporting ATPase subunit gamma
LFVDFAFSFPVFLSHKFSLSFSLSHQLIECFRHNLLVQEFSFANNLFYAMLENTASEQSARMNAMENASKNAGS